MKKNKTFLILLIVFILLLVGAGVLYRSLSDQYQQPSSLAGQETTGTSTPTTAHTEMAPSFIVTDQDGNHVELYDFLGKPVILNFWASWCGPCRSEMPEIEEAYKVYGDDIHFLIVNLTDGARETMETATNYITKTGFTFPIYFDTTLNAAAVYNAYSIPVTYFIDANGQGIARYPGAMSADILQQGIDLLLGK